MIFYDSVMVKFLEYTKKQKTGRLVRLETKPPTKLKTKDDKEVEFQIRSRKPRKVHVNFKTKNEQGIRKRILSQ